MSRLTLQWVAVDTGETYLRVVPQDTVIRIGRSPAAGWEVSGDRSMSREHADLWITDGKLAVRCLETARMPVVVEGQEVRETVLPPGTEFRIGATCFEIISDDVVALEPRAVEPEDGFTLIAEHAYARGELKKASFGASQQIEILARLPEVIAATSSDEELANAIAELLLEGIPQAEAVAVVHHGEENLRWDAAGGGEPPAPRMMKVQTRENFTARFRPSRRLMLKALASQQSVLHIWEEGASVEFTMTQDLGWAFAAPVRGEGCLGWCLYVSGAGSRKSKNFFTQEDLAGDLRFTELLTDFIGSIRQVRYLQDQRTHLSSFFSPTVIENLTSSRTQAALEPTECEVTVLFCDLRGFSRRSELLQHDLFSLLQSVSEALGVMTEGVLGLDGAIADFQGDAVLAFWGWPMPHKDGPLPACRSALRIMTQLRRASEELGSRLTGLSCGIGIAHGRALAGKIGTDKQAKIGVFGHVVNQGSRLEGLTKQFGVTICIDEATARILRDRVPASEARTCLLARVRPKGMETPMNVHALYPPEEILPRVTAKLIAIHESAVQAVIAGRWQEAISLLEQLPAENGPAAFLRCLMTRNGDIPPSDWDGAFRLDTK